VVTEFSEPSKGRELDPLGIFRTVHNNLGRTIDQAWIGAMAGSLNQVYGTKQERPVSFKHSRAILVDGVEDFNYRVIEEEAMLAEGIFADFRILERRIRLPEVGIVLPYPEVCLVYSTTAGRFGASDRVSDQTIKVYCPVKDIDPDSLQFPET